MRYSEHGLYLSDKEISDILAILRNALPNWLELIEISFLDDAHKEQYRELLNERFKRLFPSSL